MKGFLSLKPAKKAGWDNARLPPPYRDHHGRQRPLGQKAGASPWAGHRAGAEAFKKIAFYCEEIGLPYLTVYAFSTENQRRPRKRSTSFFAFSTNISTKPSRRSGKEYRPSFMGDFSYFPAAIQQKIQKVHELSPGKNGHACKYCAQLRRKGRAVGGFPKDRRRPAGGKNQKRGDFLRSGRRISLHQRDARSRYDYPPQRELRLTNFLLWQSAYSEFWFSQNSVAGFSRPEHLDAAILDYQKRNRRFGGV